MNQYQDLSRFRVPPGFRGRNLLVVQLWWLVQATLFGMSPQFANGWRRMLLRLFGARIGKNVLIRPSARITYPWRVTIGDHSWIGDETTLYSLDTIRIGAHACVSQRVYLASAGHDLGKVSFDYVTGPIVIEDECWVATGALVMPGTTIGRGAVIAAGAVVTRNVATGSLMAGVPARRIGVRGRNEETIVSTGNVKTI